jgi:hypothetical protein
MATPRARSAPNPELERGLARAAERKKAGIEPAPAPLRASFALSRAVLDAFADDVLGGYGVARCWRTPTDRTDWRGGRTTVDRDALMDHFRGYVAIGVEPLRRSIVIDVDLPAEDQQSEAPLDLKHMAAALIAGVLGDVPFVHFDSRRGPHTWVRCVDDPAPDVLQGLRERVCSVTAQIEGASIEVRPHGQQSMRLPLGVSFGIGRGPLTGDLGEADLVRWLADPRRATPEQLQPFAPAPQSPDDTRPKVASASGREQAPATAPVVATALEPPLELAGWERWCACKQAKFVQGLAHAGERHWTYLMLAAEAVLHAELSEQELVALQLALPLNDFSGSTASDRRIDARSNASTVLEAKATGRPILTGCPHNDRLRHRGRESVLRATFQAHCTHERIARCPLLYAVWPRTTAYGTTLSSSIWRSAQGKGAGLGMTARAIYEFAVERARGEPGTVGLSSRYLATKLPYITRNSAETALKKLCSDEVALLRHVRDGVYSLEPARSAEVLRQLEEQLGTAPLAEAAIARHRNDWKKSRAVARRNAPRVVDAETGR